jgi:hypothetical protein
MDQAGIRACPVACIHFDAGIDRGAYVPVCPVNAVYPDYGLPTPWRAYADIDALWFPDKEAARARVAAVRNGH